MVYRVLVTLSLALARGSAWCATRTTQSLTRLFPGSAEVWNRLLSQSLERLADAYLRAGMLKQQRVVLPPGRALDRFAAAVFSRRTYQLVFQELYAETCEEWREAHEAGRRWLVHWIRFRFYLVFSWTVVGKIWDSTGGTVIRGVFKYIGVG